MKKYYFLFFLLFFLPSVLGIMNSNLVFRWDFEQQYTRPNGTDVWRFVNNVTNIGLVQHTGCKIGTGCKSFTGSSQFNFNYAGLPTGNVNATEALWVNITGVNGYFVSWGTAGAGQASMFGNDGSTPPKLTYGKYGGDAAPSNESYSLNNYHLIGYSKSGNSITYYIDGRKLNTVTLTGQGVALAYGLLGGNYPGTVKAPPGKFDEACMWNIPLNPGNWSLLWNNGVGNNCSYVVAAAPSLIPVVNWAGYPPPSGDRQNNLSRMYFYNLSGVGVSSCQLKDSLSAVLVNNSFHHITGQKYNLTASALIEGTHSFSVRCLNGSVLYNSSVKTLIVDLTFPSITLNPKNFFSNGSYVGLKKNQRAFVNFTFQDETLLYAYQFKFYNASRVFLNFTNTSLTGTKYVFTRAVNVSNLPGLYWVNVSVWDAHTSKAIENYPISVVGDTLSFGKGLKIQAVGVKSMLADKNGDRYNPKFTYDKAGKRDFVLSGLQLEYLPDSPFPGHFVDWSSKRWVDFDCSGKRPSKVEKQGLDYVVSFDDLPAQVVCHSVGGLNGRSAIYVYHVVSVPVLSWVSENVYLPASNRTNVTLIVSGMFLNATKVYLYNASGSLKNTSSLNVRSNTTTVFTVNYRNLIGSKYYFNASHKSSLNDSVKSVKGQIARLIVENCSSYHNQTVIFNFLDEDNPTNGMTVTYELDFQYWSIGQPKLSYLRKSSGTSLTLCFAPSNWVYYADVVLKHTSATNQTTYFLLYNHSFSNVTQTFSLYNLMRVSGTYGLKNTVRYKSNYQSFTNIVGVLQRRYVGEGIYRSVQYSLSGQFGEQYYTILPNTQDYQFLFYDQSNHLLGQSATLKFVCDNYNILCDTTYLLDEFTANVSKITPVITYAYNNNTKMLTASYNAVLPVNLSFRVVKRGNDLEICSQFVYGSSGSFSCNLSQYSGSFGIYGSVNNELVGSDIVTVQEQTLADIMGPGPASFLAFIIMLAVAGICVVNPVLGGVGIAAGAIGVYYLGFMPYITIPVLVFLGIAGIVVGWLADGRSA